jgi:hypothetical protein
MWLTIACSWVLGGNEERALALLMKDEEDSISIETACRLAVMFGMCHLDALSVLLIGVRTAGTKCAVHPHLGPTGAEAR